MLWRPREITLVLRHRRRRCGGDCRVILRCWATSWSPCKIAWQQKIKAHNQFNENLKTFFERGGAYCRWHSNEWTTPPTVNEYAEKIKCRTFRYGIQFFHSLLNQFIVLSLWKTCRYSLLNLIKILLKMICCTCMNSSREIKWLLFQNTTDPQWIFLSKWNAYD